MIVWQDVDVVLDEQRGAVLSEVSAAVREGELCVVAGRTGSGKSTLLRTVNGLVPRASGGRLRGSVHVADRDVGAHRPRDLADVVGFAGQDPRATLVADTVRDEVAHAPENLGLPARAVRRRVAEALDLLGVGDLADRPVGALSGGEVQRVAVAAVLSAHPSVLVLDEPTSALDPVSAEEVLASVLRLVVDAGLTVLLAEHRLERVVAHADRLLLLADRRAASAVAGPDGGGLTRSLAASAVAPPLIALGGLLGWDPPPAAVRDARRLRSLPAALAEAPQTAGAASGDRPAGGAAGEPLVRVRGLGSRRSGRIVLRDVDLDVAVGEVVAVTGRTGSGKTSLLALLAGLVRPDAGGVQVLGRAPHGRPGREVVADVALVPQDPTLLLYAETVAQECAVADAEHHLLAGTTAAAVDALLPGLPPDAHPRSLSEGQRLALALGVVLAPRPRVVLLDEPTRGLDVPGKDRLVGLLAGLAGDGHGVVVATHDVEVAARVAHRVVVLAGGEVVDSGGARDVLTAAPASAPQVAKVLAPQPWLTVDEVAAALGGTGGSTAARPRAVGP